VPLGEARSAASVSTNGSVAHTPETSPDAGERMILDPLERTRTELELAPGFLVRSAPEPRCVVDRVRA
jgi:hypothetical protein